MAVRDRVGKHRDRMREQGFRLVQVWVPDVRSERFAAEAHRQSVAVASADRGGAVVSGLGDERRVLHLGLSSLE
ncbi:MULTISPECIES: antitoxin MazE family protein [unclassified Cryobacterium]|uniref:antitoxin MazE family protein n=1 Tax=unclassified Cryobacterium TaxID=2649013 RepID=UPI002B223444|nr:MULTISPECIES: antitoxin MazE family protein [unclassified Cryobacterium]MEB0001037.1 antitoxin MazE family protein [Cryobacterium sp. RTS3]MEB0267584.1 antitoxin MazE family protein [Cryobacterium sp. 10I5]